MSLLSSQFDVLRNWPDGGALEEDFAPESGAIIVAGDLVIVRSDGGVSRVTTTDSIPAQGSATPLSLWIALEGNGPNDFDVLETGLVTCLRADMIEVQTDQFVTASYTPGQLLTVSNGSNSGATNPTGSDGKLTARTGANEQVVGVCLSYNSVSGILVAMLNSL